MVASDKLGVVAFVKALVRNGPKVQRFFREQTGKPLPTWLLVGFLHPRIWTPVTDYQYQKLVMEDAERRMKRLRADARR